FSSGTGCSLDTQPHELGDGEEKQNEVSTVEEEVVRDLLHHLDAHKSRVSIKIQERREPLAGKLLAERLSGGRQDTQIPPSGGCLDELSAATRGSAGLDLAVGVDITIVDDSVHVVPSAVTGPLGHGLMTVAFSQLITNNKPMRTVTILGNDGVKICSEQVMLDTGADVTIIPYAAWPSSWPLIMASNTV
ncbi:unnamed protein product, partial [Bubo scandiacus]